MTLVESDTIFGRLVTGHDVEGWVADVQRKWSCTYLCELERQHGIEPGYLQSVRGWVLSPTFDKWPEDQIPGVLVVSPGLVPPPVKDGAGVYRARWRIDVGVICSARTQELSHQYAMLYLRAHSAIVAHRPSLEGHALAADWLDEVYTPLEYDDTRSLYAGFASFSIEVDDVMTARAGPTDPDPQDPCTDPYGEWPIVLTHHERVDHYPPPDPLPEQEEA